MKRFFLIALAAGLFSSINANGAPTLEFSIRRKTNPFTDRRVCWGGEGGCPYSKDKTNQDAKTEQVEETDA